MGALTLWIKNATEHIAGAPPLQLTFAPSVSAPHIGAAGLALVPHECYVELYLESCRLTRARTFGTTFHGVVYSFITLPRQGAPSAKLAVLSKPANLTELDMNAVDHVITVSRRLMGATPFRGGPVDLELGLFSVKSGNVLTPVVNYLTKVSSTAGISYIGAIQPFLPLITEGMDLLGGQSGNTELEVGVDTTLAPDTSFVSAILACRAGTIDTKSLELQEDGTLTSHDRPVEVGYTVFSLRRTLEKADFGEIPQLAQRYNAFEAAMLSGQYGPARDALSAFRLATLASADLISSDANRLYLLAKDRLDMVFPPAGEAWIGDGEWRQQSLAEIGLYD